MVLMNLATGIKIVIQVKHSYSPEHVEVRESLYNHVISWVVTILNHNDTRVSLHRYKGSWIVYRSE